jgi:hypothetical protein
MENIGKNNRYCKICVINGINGIRPKGTASPKGPTVTPKLTSSETHCGCRCCGEEVAGRREEVGSRRRGEGG